MVPTAIAVEKPTYRVALGSVTAQLVKSGRIAPVRQDQLAFPLEGSLATLTVGKGDAVRAGDVVATLDTAALEQLLQAAEADLELAQAQLATAEENQAANFRRAEIGIELAQLRLDFAVAEAGAVPTAEEALTIEVLKRELELAQLDLGALQQGVDPLLSNQVAQMQREVEGIEARMAQSALVAPLDGTVTAVYAAPGDLVAAGEPVLAIADLTRAEVQLPLVERELQQLTEGMVAVGIVPAQPETTFPMTVRQLPYPYGTGVQGSEANGLALVAFDDPTQAAALSMGARIEVAVLLDRHEAVLWLPPAAIREFNGRLFVVVQEGEAQKRLDVKVGLQNEQQVEITSGVTEGQQVVGP